jgi:hypothetical protein
MEAKTAFAARKINLNSFLDNHIAFFARTLAAGKTQ